jgi:Zn-dependent protease
VPLEDILLQIPVLLFSIVAHEYAHAEAAYRQGDTTAFMLGRLTLNPLKHIDPLMTIILPTLLIVTHAPFVFGAAKPVPVNPRNYRRYVRGDIIVSLAGIATNLALFVLCAIAFALVGTLAHALATTSSSVALLQRMLFWGMYLNVVLACFNLIPIPPLDGGNVLLGLLPPQLARHYSQLRQYGFLILYALMLSGYAARLILPPTAFLYGVLVK